MAKRYEISDNQTVHLKDNTVLEFFELMGEHITLILTEDDKEVARYDGRDSIPTEYNLRQIRQISQDEDRVYRVEIIGTVIGCCMDVGVDRDSRCVKCCIYCEDKDTCEYSCEGLVQWNRNENEIAKNCTFAC
jgi:hypothetical protein